MHAIFDPSIIRKKRETAMTLINKERILESNPHVNRTIMSIYIRRKSGQF